MDKPDDKPGETGPHGFERSGALYVAMRRTTFAIALRDGTFADVEAYEWPVRRTTTEGAELAYTFVVHRLHASPHLWRVSDPMTGYGVAAPARSRKEACASADAVFASYGLAEIVRRITDAAMFGRTVGDPEAEQERPRRAYVPGTVSDGQASGKVSK